jgi:C4-dicarboxylate-specific signal transduction histidine kinase
MPSIIRFLDPGPLTAHGVSMLWRPELIWLHAISDALIGLAFWSIPIALAVMARRRRDLAFPWVFNFLIPFILFCGATHFAAIWVLWVPAYGVEGVLKAITALLGVITAALIWLTLPRMLALPSPQVLAATNVALRQEIDERHEAETRLHAMHAELVETARRATIGTLCAGMAHEMSQPVNIIALWAERARGAMEAGPLVPPRLERALTVVGQQTRRIGLLLDGIRQLSREAHVEGTVFDAAAAAIAAVEALEPTEANISLRIPATPMPVRGSRQELTEALTHLLRNAQEAIRRRHLDEPEAPAEIWLEMAPGPQPGMLTIECRDTGGGVPPELGQRIFEPFVTTKGPQEGSGLGLAIAASLARTMGGRLDYRNLEEGGWRTGAAFRMILPLAMASPS